MQPSFSYLISELANWSFEEGIFPSSFKTAQITPILKKPSLDPEDPSSYRPISNLRTISKLLERLVHSRLAQHLITSPAFSTFQSAYRQMHSTETALIKVTNDFFNSTAAGTPSIFLALDLSAALTVSPLLSSCKGWLMILGWIALH